jgi:hypothetical protein
MKLELDANEAALGDLGALADAVTSAARQWAGRHSRSISSHPVRTRVTVEDDPVPPGGGVPGAASGGITLHVTVVPYRDEDAEPQPEKHRERHHDREAG